MKYIPPSIKEKAFNCPHCRVLTVQTWGYLYYKDRPNEHPLPGYIGPGGASERDFFKEIEDPQMRNSLIEWANNMGRGLPFLEKLTERVYPTHSLWNLSTSTCFNCNEISIWIQDKLVHPVTGSAPPVNPDMPADIRRDYEEASSILDLSPRGAAALLRLCIQKICKKLGQPGENINKDIGSLVAAGLDQRIQQALDVVRVIGNNAVHPGQIDFKDDRSTAETLFKLLNIIVEKLISEPKHVAELYGSLPETVRNAIENRDKPKS
ncbi:MULTISPECIES: DUF4145 domain-containing protein [unclassified Pseudomonas]|uniref:DUF4145 domain-containing protein n=1 Tax=unclassified Pseudomonas TaxID=196821 RepID=UPI000D9ADDC9|nr:MULTISPECIES: DUF4145 domain-containing protein [unclassified Pseudomonas]PYG83241.1 uncharacterized protein DUF4145 [Pseudomonas sp. RV120224-01c]PYG86437.1 uncharacterized protein DUF4145 [Pseudomonas sp. RV120224-01b]